jgi:guanylate kinase
MLIALVGPSGIGKGYVRERIFDVHPHVQEFTWLTTRDLRQSEKDARSNRRSISIERFEHLERMHQLVLVQRIHGNAYALERSSLDRAINTNILTELHIENVPRVRALGIPVFALALVPGSLSFLRRRLSTYRGTETNDQIDERMLSATTVIEQIRACTQLFEYVITVTEQNQHQTVQEVINILRPFLEER